MGRATAWRDGARLRGSALRLLLATVLPALASAQEPTASAPAERERPRVAMKVGLGGFTSWHQTCAPVVVDVEGGTQPFDGTLLIRSVGSSTRLAIPLQAEPGARRRLEHVACAIGANSWEWSLDDGATWSAEGLTAVPAPGIPILAVIGPGIGRLPALEEALGGQASTNPDEDRTAVLDPAAVPREATAWSQAPFVLLDAKVTSELDPQAVLALRDHVASGATLFVAGLEDPSLPEELLAGTLTTDTQFETTLGDGSARAITARLVEPHATAIPVPWAGENRPWMAVRRLGSGRVVLAGIDLGQAATREGLDAEFWLAAAGLTPNSMTPQTIEPPPWAQLVEGALDRSTSARLTSGPVPPFVAGAYLVVVGSALGAATWLLGRRKDRPATKREHAVLLACLAAPGFLVGAFRAQAAGMTVTVVEYWPAQSRARRITWTPVQGAGPTRLPEGAHELRATGMLSHQFPPSTLTLGPLPAIDAAEVPRFSRLTVRTTAWREQGRAELDALRGVAPEIAVISNVVTGTAFGPDSELLGEIAKAAASGGLRNGRVVMAPAGPSGERTAWIVHEDVPGTTP